MLSSIILSNLLVPSRIPSISGDQIFRKINSQHIGILHMLGILTRPDQEQAFAPPLLLEMIIPHSSLSTHPAK